MCCWCYVTGGCDGLFSFSLTVFCLSFYCFTVTFIVCWRAWCTISILNVRMNSEKLRTRIGPHRCLSQSAFTHREGDGHVNKHCGIWRCCTWSMWHKHHVEGYAWEHTTHCLILCISGVWSTGKSVSVLVMLYYKFRPGVVLMMFRFCATSVRYLLIPWWNDLCIFKGFIRAPFY